MRALFLLAITTFSLILVIIFSAMNISFNWVFLLMILGQVLLAVTVYKVLRDNYQTTKTFDDFYEDRPGLGS